MLNKLVLGGLALSASLAPISPAAAAVITSDYIFTADTGDWGLGSYSGSFSLALDDVKLEYTLTALDFSNGTVDFDLSNSGLDDAFGSTIFIGGNVSGVNAVVHLTDDFYLNILNIDQLDAVFFAVAQSGVPSIGEDFTQAFGGTLVITRVDVPEPATWTMLLIGFAAAGFALRSSRKVHLRRLSA